jgi:hypothetical protein
VTASPVSIAGWAHRVWVCIPVAILDTHASVALEESLENVTSAEVAHNSMLHRLLIVEFADGVGEGFMVLPTVLLCYDFTKDGDELLETLDQSVGF